jgi:hypothetical protein
MGFFLSFFSKFHNLLRIKNEGVKCKKGLFSEIALISSYSALPPEVRVSTFPSSNVRLCPSHRSSSL